MRKFLFLFSGIIFFTIFFYANTTEAVISRRLQLGSVGQDVKELQQVLNSDPDTVVTYSGIGSSGQETTYFGLLTKRAVIKFQNKYKSEVLSPAGLTYGTGIVGPMTLAKLRTLNMATNNTTSPSPSPVVSVVVEKPVELDPLAQITVKDSEKIDIYTTDKIQAGYQNVLWGIINNAINSRTKPDFGDTVTKIGSASKVLIYAMNKSVAKTGDDIEISGAGLSKDTYLYIGSTYRIKPTISSGQSLIFKIPKLPLGRYDVALSNSAGISQSAVLVITADGKSALKVTDTDPQNVSFGETITIKGEGFVSSNNEVRTSYGRINSVSSSDGKSISFKVEPEALRETVKAKSFGQLYPVEFIVINSNGVSEPKQFTIRY